MAGVSKGHEIAIPSEKKVQWDLAFTASLPFMWLEVSERMGAWTLHNLSKPGASTWL